MPKVGHQVKAKREAQYDITSHRTVKRWRRTLANRRLRARMKAARRREARDG